MIHLMVCDTIDPIVYVFKKGRFNMIKSVIEYLDISAGKHPNRIAFKDDQDSITYSDLQTNAKAMGSAIVKSLDQELRKPVVVFVDRTIKSLISFMGVVYSGNFYVPIDITQPKKRIDLILETLEPSLIIGSKDQSKQIMSLELSTDTKYYEDLIEDSIDESILKVVGKKVLNTDPLYTMFTSGSTGVPKGVVISHLSIVDLVEQFSKEFNFTEENIFGNQAPFDFDVSVKDIYSSIKHGSTLVIIPRVCFSFPKKLIEFLEEHKINTCIWSTSVLRLVANMKGLEGQKPSHINKIMFSGEVMPNKVLNYWRKHLPEVTYINLYGPTEITCNCSYYIVDRAFDDNEPLPIGQAFENTDIIILNEKGTEAKVDEIGEICVRGSSLALGYYNNKEISDQAFCQNSLNPFYHELIYKTGDLGKYGCDGLLYFISRKDHQIKHMGHRIELGEIEVIANSLDIINMGCCIYDKENERIILFYESDKEKNRDIYKEMLKDLPKYMVPNKMIWFDKLPLNKNGKIDRPRLTKDYTHGTS